MFVVSNPIPRWRQSAFSPTRKDKSPLSQCDSSRASKLSRLGTADDPTCFSTLAGVGRPPFNVQSPLSLTTSVPASACSRLNPASGAPAFVCRAERRTTVKILPSGRPARVVEYTSFGVCCLEMTFRVCCLADESKQVHVSGDQIVDPVLRDLESLLQNCLVNSPDWPHRLVVG